MNKRDFDKAVERVKREYGVKNVDFKDFGRISASVHLGECTYTKGYITLNEKLKKDYSLAIKVLYHEVGHIYCYKNGIWKSYHNEDDNNLTKKQKELIRRTGLKAERWVDDWASKRIKEQYPRLRFFLGYKTEEVTKRFKKKLKENYG